MDPSFEWTIVPRFVVALAMGLLAGLERETGRRGNQKFFFGGIRTFPLISLYGFACAWLFNRGATLVLPVGLLSVTALAGIAYIEKIRTGRLGATSEIAALATFVMGALALLADVRIPIAIGVVNTLLLSEKSVLESYVERLDHAELLATLKFLLVSVVIYPVLPNQDYTVYRINPAHVWEIVVLVSAVGFAGYFLVRKLGSRVGLPLSGLMGGVVSSTAVSIAAGRIARQHPGQAGAALRASMLAGSVMYVRLLVLIAILGGEGRMSLEVRLILLALVGLVLAATVRVAPVGTGDEQATAPVLRNPVEIRVALLFALLFVGLRIATGLASEHYGHTGVLAMGALAGLADVDPFVLSLVQGAHGARLILQGVLLAVMVNTLAKGCYFAVLSGGNRGPALARYLLWAALHIPVVLY
jgi:uncharacterized membrane protein (DUF4010 family)